MGSISALSLRRQLFLAISFALIPLFAAVTWSGWLSFRERRNELGQQAQILASTIAALSLTATRWAIADGQSARIPVPEAPLLSSPTLTAGSSRTGAATPRDPPRRHRRANALGSRSSASISRRRRRRAHAPAAPDRQRALARLRRAAGVARLRSGDDAVVAQHRHPGTSPLAAGCSCALLLSNRLVDAVGYLDGTAQRIASGDFGPIQPKRMFSREFAELQAAFESMLQRFNATREQLDAQMSEERRMREELESLQGQVIRQERLAAVGQLVSGVAHEINNPLQSISGFAELLRLQRNLPESAHNDLNVILRESARANAIIRNLALFARQQPDRQASSGSATSLPRWPSCGSGASKSEQIELRIEDASTQPVLAVLTELQQVVLNFVVNAEQAILQSGRIPARDDPHLRPASARGAGGRGHGSRVKPKDELHLFEPFFTTKPVGQGTGLGLSISYGIIESMGGTIGYRPAPASADRSSTSTCPAADNRLSAAAAERRQADGDAIERLVRRGASSFEVVDHVTNASVSPSRVHVAGHRPDVRHRSGLGADVARRRRVAHASAQRAVDAGNGRPRDERRTCLTGRAYAAGWRARLPPTRCRVATVRSRRRAAEPSRHAPCRRAASRIPRAPRRWSELSRRRVQAHHRFGVQVDALLQQRLNDVAKRPRAMRKHDRCARTVRRRHHVVDIPRIAQHLDALCLQPVRRAFANQIVGLPTATVSRAGAAPAGIEPAIVRNRLSQAAARARAAARSRRRR